MEKIGGKKVKKYLRNIEKNQTYESDSDENPYYTGVKYAYISYPYSFTFADTNQRATLIAAKKKRPAAKKNAKRPKKKRRKPQRKSKPTWTSKRRKKRLPLPTIRRTHPWRSSNHHQRKLPQQTQR